MPFERRRLSGPANRKAPVRLFRAKLLLLLSGCFAVGDVRCQPPDAVDDMIYRERVQFVDGSLGSTVLLTSDGRYSTIVVYHALSRAVWITGTP